MFPTPAHISKAIACFNEVMPENTRDDYSFLSEYCHPNMLAFLQYYCWLSHYEVAFVDHDAQGVFGSTAAACVMGLMAIEETLVMIGESAVVNSLRKLFRVVVEQAKGAPQSKSAEN
jgi:fatty acid desaturase